ncbi:tetratricopeptide repeat protein [Barnesiella sp. An55]|uniref:tetratricopeptide repeat protein n=1 Tax=Barnesiella sp. An55 TaxID=1965646 RepID=UPI00130273BD|nr:tetratricopeptide repeat protein [Barnesiella sp. An55]HIZ27176.1 tetratricopeptide repeat protein [Candidatus Barnesiella merdipullorum]
MENPNFQEARTTIQGAFTDPETKDDAKTWYVAGFIENTFFEKDNVQKALGMTLKDGDGPMYDALIKSYEYFLKSIALDTLPNEKGKVKPKYVKDIRKTLKQNIDGYANAGVYYFNQKDYKKAYDVWGIYLDIPKLSIMKGEKEGLPADSTLAILEYNRALAALQTQDNALAISALNDAKGNGYNQNDIYKYLVYEYEQTQDTVNLIKTLQEGEKLFKNEMIEVRDESGNPVMDENGQPKMQKENTYTLKLINLYIYGGKYDEAIATLESVLAEEPDKAEYWNVKGNLYESQKKYDQSIECFEKAISIDPNYADALGNLGRIYFNMAVQKNNEISSITDNVKYNEAREKEVIPLFEKSCPYYEKAYELKPDEPDYKYALRNIYYNLNYADKLKAIEGQ